MELAKRKDVPVELTWDLTAIYDGEAKLTADLEKVRALTDEMETAYKGKLSTAETILACLDQYRVWTELNERAGNYVQLASEVDFTDAALQELSLIHI